VIFEVDNMFKGKILARLIDKNTGKVKQEIDVTNQIVDGIYTMMFVAARNLSTLNVYIGYDATDTVAANDPTLHWANISSLMIDSKSRGAVDMGYQSYEYRCLYPDSSFAPPASADRNINLIALKHSDGNTLYAYKKLTTPIVQTTSDYLELIYALSAVIG